MCVAPRARVAGQATVELVAMLPLLLVVALAAAQVLAAGAAWSFAGHAAEAGAMALVQGGGASEAAREAVPGWSHARMDVAVEGETVRVSLRPPSLFPSLAAALTSHATAAGGP